GALRGWRLDRGADEAARRAARASDRRLQPRDRRDHRLSPRPRRPDDRLREGRDRGDLRPNLPRDGPALAVGGTAQRTPAAAEADRFPAPIRLPAPDARPW